MTDCLGRGARRMVIALCIRFRLGLHTQASGKVECDMAKASKDGPMVHSTAGIGRKMLFTDMESSSILMVLLS